MVTLDEVAAMALELPETAEGVSRGWRTWTVRSKGFAWERPFSKADIRRFGDTTPPEGPILGLRAADLGEKEAILASGEKGFFTIEHFNGFAGYLVQLKVASKRSVREAVVDAWLACAPPALADSYVASHKRR